MGFPPFSDSFDGYSFIGIFLLIMLFGPPIAVLNPELPVWKLVLVPGLWTLIALAAILGPPCDLGATV